MLFLVAVALAQSTLRGVLPGEWSMCGGENQYTVSINTAGSKGMSGSLWRDTSEDRDSSDIDNFLISAFDIRVDEGIASARDAVLNFKCSNDLRCEGVISPSGITVVLELTNETHGTVLFNEVSYAIVKRNSVGELGWMQRIFGNQAFLFGLWLAAMIIATLFCVSQIRDTKQHNSKTIQAQRKKDDDGGNS